MYLPYKLNSYIVYVGQLAIAVAASNMCNSASREDYHTKGVIKDIKQYHSEGVCYCF